MSEQDGAQSSTKHARSRNTRKQNGTQTSALQGPTNDNTESRKAYRKEQGQSWRTEPEIDAERQKYLTERRAIVPDIKQDIYLFRNVKLNCADVEWLLATHENRCGPVGWSDSGQRECKGLDLRGADLRKANLHNLPLSTIIQRLWDNGCSLSIGNAVKVM